MNPHSGNLGYIAREIGIGIAGVVVLVLVVALVILIFSALRRVDLWELQNRRAASNARRPRRQRYTRGGRPKLRTVATENAVANREGKLAGKTGTVRNGQVFK